MQVRGGTEKGGLKVRGQRALRGYNDVGANVSRLTWGTAGRARDRAAAEVIGGCGPGTQAARPPLVATQSGLGYTERRTWPKRRPPAMTEGLSTCSLRKTQSLLGARHCAVCSSLLLR